MKDQLQPSTWEAIGSAVVSLIPTGFVAAIAFAIIFMISIAVSEHRAINQSDLALTIALVLPATFIGATMFGFMFGLPAFMLGWYFKLIHWWSSMILGFLLPFCFVVLLSLISFGPSNTSFMRSFPNEFTWLISLSGGIAGFAFWLIWKPVSNFAANFSKNKQYQD